MNRAGTGRNPAHAGDLRIVANAVVHAPQWSCAHPDRGWGIALAALGVLCTVGAEFFGWMMAQNDRVGMGLATEQRQLEPAVLRRAGSTGR